MHIGDSITMLAYFCYCARHMINMNCAMKRYLSVVPSLCLTHTVLV